MPWLMNSVHHVITPNSRRGLLYRFTEQHSLVRRCLDPLLNKRRGIVKYEEHMNEDVNLGEFGNNDGKLYLIRPPDSDSISQLR